MVISYAQNFEDIILWRALKHVEKGFYIDIGAQDPVVDSVSLAFYEKGWRGVHVEPVPARFIHCYSNTKVRKLRVASDFPRTQTATYWRFPSRANFPIQTYSSKALSYSVFRIGPTRLIASLRMRPRNGIPFKFSKIEMARIAAKPTTDELAIHSEL